MTVGLLVLVVLAQAAGETGTRVDLFKPAKAEKDAPTYRLEPEKDGYVYRGPEFTAHVARDGVVQFKNKSSLKRVLPLPTPLPPGTPTLASLVKDHLSRRPRKPAPPSNEPTPPPPGINQAPTIWPSASAQTAALCENPNDPRCPYPKNTQVIPGGALADWDRFLLGLPQHESSRKEKARFLAATEPMRMRMAEEARAEDLRAALWDLPALLESIWSSKHPPAERRRLLHQLWLEYAEMPGNESSSATIISFIRRRLPASSPEAYTADELARLRPNAGPRFDPYRP